MNYILLLQSMAVAYWIVFGIKYIFEIKYEYSLIMFGLAVFFSFLYWFALPKYFERRIKNELK